jgi:hypothetical protein
MMMEGTGWAVWLVLAALSLFIVALLIADTMQARKIRRQNAANAKSLLTGITLDNAINPPMAQSEIDYYNRVDWR